LAGNVEQKTGYKIADVVEKKSVAVGAGALVLGMLFPEFAVAALTVATWEAAQVVGAEAYKRRQKAKAKEMKPGVVYDLAA